MAEEVFLMEPFGEKDSNKPNLSSKCLLPPFFSEIEQKIKEAPVRKDDVWMVSFPRTGSTWCQEIIWLIMNNSDFQTAQSTFQQIRAPLIECQLYLFEFVDSIESPNSKVPLPRYKRSIMPLDLLPTEKEVKNHLQHLFTDSVGFVDSLTSPRCIKSHLTVELLPEAISLVKPKIIYILRNPKDVCVSYYFYSRMANKLDLPFDTFCELFMNGALPGGGIFSHYLGFWNKRNEPNVLVLKYEDVRSDRRQAVKKIAEFLEKSLSDEQVDAICHFLSFENMRENKGCNLQLIMENKQGDDFYNRTETHFIRKGIVGDHKNYMSQSMNEKFDKWIEDNTRGTDLAFK